MRDSEFFAESSLERPSPFDRWYSVTAGSSFLIAHPNDVFTFAGSRSDCVTKISKQIDFCAKCECELSGFLGFVKATLVDLPDKIEFCKLFLD